MKKATKKKPAPNGRTHSEQQLYDDKRRLKRAVREHQAITSLSKRLTRQIARADQAVIDMAHELLRAKGVLPFTETAAK